MSTIYRGKVKRLPLIMAVATVVIGATPLFLLGQASAAPFQKAFVRLDRLKATTATGGRICVQPASTGTTASIQVVFPTTSGTDYVVNATAANWTVDTTNLDSGQTAMPTIGTATSVSGKTVTFPLGTPQTLTVGTLYCFNFAATNTLTTSSAGATETTQGSVATLTSAPADIDRSYYSESIISNDQVVVTGVVPPSFSFALSGNTDAFASNLSTTSTVSTAGRTVTIITNANSGWIVWVKGTNASGGKGALQSATAGSYKITGTGALGSTARTLTNGTEDYGLGVTYTDASGGGTVTPSTAYDSTASTKIGTIDPGAFRPIASSNGTANSDVVTLTERATIAGQTPAASDYTDTLTVIGAGQF